MTYGGQEVVVNWKTGKSWNNYLSQLFQGPYSQRILRNLQMAQKAKMLVDDSLVQPSLMFMGKARRIL